MGKGREMIVEKNGTQIFMIVMIRQDLALCFEATLDKQYLLSMPLLITQRILSLENHNKS
jgi:hypothetical protein